MERESFPANGTGSSSDKLKTLVKMKNLMCLKIIGLGKKNHRLKIPNFLCTSDLTQPIPTLLAAPITTKK